MLAKKQQATDLSGPFVPVGWLNLLLFRGFVGLDIKNISAPRLTSHVASVATPHVTRGDRSATVHAGSYRTLLEWMVLKRTVLEQMVLEQSATVRDLFITSSMADYPIASGTPGRSARPAQL